MCCGSPSLGRRCRAADLARKRREHSGAPAPDGNGSFFMEQKDIEISWTHHF